MPRENNSNFLRKARKPFAKPEEQVPLQPQDLPISLLLTKPAPPTPEQSQFHTQTLQPESAELPSSNLSDWAPDDEVRLSELHNQLGNRWSLISRTFSGKSDNCIKNHFFSRLRMSLRHLNKQLSSKSPTKPVKMHVIYKIMATCEDRFNPESEYKQSFINFSYQIKNKILDFLQKENAPQSEVEKLIDDIHQFNRQFKMRGDILRIPKTARIPKTKQQRDEQIEEDNDNFFSSPFRNYSDGGQVRPSDVPSQGNLEAILEEGMRLSEMLQLKEERVEIRMVDTSDYLFNEEDPLYYLPQLQALEESIWGPFF